jgi:DNA modification methylase
MRKSKKKTLHRSDQFCAGDRNKIHLGDARQLVKLLQDESVALTVTSPPYFDLKDYGANNQIGFGQSYQDYLEDLSLVFSEVHRATKHNGSLWIVIDTFRRNHEVCPLPFDLASKLAVKGWSLRDIIIWKKDRTLPWTHAGTTKKIFEYILVFAKKGSVFRHEADKFRESIDLKRWCVQYPERYNPKGKALEEIWNFDIPTQGSWGSVHISHFCPLPAELVTRIIKLTTKKSDLVLDPFAGTGTVPAQAYFAGREYLGIELNKEYIKMFQAYLQASLRKNPSLTIETESQQRVFQKNILHLRALKFARLIYSGINVVDIDYGVEHILVWPLSKGITEKNKVLAVQYVLVLRHEEQIVALAEKILSLIKAKPLSRFGIEATIGYVRKTNNLEGFGGRQTTYVYTKSNTHSYTQKVSLAEALMTKFPVISTIGLKLEVPND